MTKIFRLDASMRHEGSLTRKRADALVSHLDGMVLHRDLASMPLPMIDEEWINANFTPEEKRTDAQNQKLSYSDELVKELQEADILVLAVPVYNFSMPAAFKAWVDLIARARLTFRYTENGPEGLLKDKKAYIVTASGGVPLGSPADHLSPYIKHVLGFVGVTDVVFLDSEKLDQDANSAIQAGSVV